MPGQKKRNLVICRVGDRSLHRSWLGDPATRSYDVWLDSYCEDPARYAGDPARFSVARDTTKVPRVAELVRERPELLTDWDAIWLPDDDLAFDAATAERLFEVFHALELDLAQPALAEGSFYSHVITLRNGGFAARLTNFVEPMAPVFSRRAFQRLWTTFDEIVSGWGLDYVWPTILGNPTDRLAIVDDAPVLHTRAVSTADWYRRLAVQPAEEREQLLTRYGVPRPHRLLHYGGVPAGAPLSRDALVPVGAAFALRLARGAPRRYWLVRRYWSRLWRSVVHGRRALRAAAAGAPGYDAR